MLSNNDILKKIRIALSLRDEDMIHILSLADFKMTKGALNDLFRHEDHPSYEEAGDQVLRNFLNGLIIYKRGPMDKPKSEESKSNAVKKVYTKDRSLRDKKE